MTATIIESYNGSSALTVVAYGDVGQEAQRVTPANGMPTRPDGVGDGAVTAAWDGTAVNSNGYGSAVISVTGIAGGDSYAIKGSVTGANPKVLAVQDLGSTTGAMAASITADGIYLVPAAGQLTFVKTGAASTPTVNMLLKR